MGLSAPKNRMKLSQDPNNTKWTSDTQSFGLKMMAAQGWKAGELLGAKDAPHAEFHTAANASHIRVTVKDDNLGLGAKIGSGVGHGECTGLDAFKNLLGRLNGKDEDELEKEQKSREDLKRAIYTERKWGSIRFVQGGFLVGDKIQLLIDGEAERVRKLAAGDAGSDSDSSDSSDSDEEPEPLVRKPKKSKKRKLGESAESPEAVSVKVNPSKKRKLEGQEGASKVIAVEVKKSKKKRKSERLPEDNAEVTAAQENVKTSKKKSKRQRDSEAEDEDEAEESGVKKRRKDKKETKDKKDRKEKREVVQDEDSAKQLKKKSKREKKKRDTESALETTQLIQDHTSVESGRSTPIMAQGRHAVRARNIAQKRLASMDVASLNQIFMIKS